MNGPVKHSSPGDSTSTETLVPTRLSVGAKVFTHVMSPLGRTILGRPICQINEVKITKLFGTSSDIEAVFGPQDQVQRMIALTARAVNEAPYTALGRVVHQQEMKMAAEARRVVMEYIVSNPSIQDVKIKSPLVVLGLPRSGTTLIHRLLACDPVARGFKTFEMLASLGSDLVPPPNKTNYTNHRNITTIEKGMTRLELLFPNWLSEYRESHFTAADEYEEEVLIAMHQGYNFVNHPAVLEMYRNQSYMLQVYVYMKRYIQMLVSGFTNVSHIVLKSPIHSDSLHALLSVFPDARVVIMNRSSTQVVPSATLLTSRMISSKIKPGKIDAREFGQQTLDRMVSMHKSIVTFCGLVAARQVKLMPNVATDPPMKDHQVSASQFINVEYDDLVTRPVETVHAVYKHFGMPVTKEFDDAMREYLAENPQGKHVKSRLDSKQMFGFTDTSILKAFEAVQTVDH